MSRIFDALRKAGGPRPAPGPVPVIESAVGAAASRATVPVPAAVVHGLPLAGIWLPDDETLHQMASLRVSVEAALPERATRTVAFVASLSGEGATTVARQFAATLARDERARVVVVDGNARDPSLSVDLEGRVVRFRKGRNGPGPDGGATNLHGLALSDEMVEDGLFQPGAARAILESLAASYDWVVVDLPPALEAPDSSTLAGLADGVVLVVQSGRTKRPVVSRAADLLRQAGARVIGTVLNRRRLEIPEFIYRRI